LGLRTDILLFYLLTSGTGSHLVCQTRLAYSSTSYPNVRGYEGRTGLSPPAAYLSTVEYEAKEDSLKPRHHVYTFDYYSSVSTRVTCLYQGPSTRASAMGTDDKPANK
jgi:hypothetical protein